MILLSRCWVHIKIHNLAPVKPVLSDHSKRRPKIGFQDQLSLNAGQKYCRMLQREHSAMFTVFIKLPCVFRIFVLSIFEWQLKTGLRPFLGGTSFVDHLCYLCILLVMLSHLFIAALCSPEGKGLTSWLLLVMFIVILLLSHLVSWTGVALDCIDSWSLLSFLFNISWVSVTSKGPFI